LGINAEYRKTLIFFHAWCSLDTTHASKLTTDWICFVLYDGDMDKEIWNEEEVVAQMIQKLHWMNHVREMLVEIKV
jgi:hypothetical protein